MTTDTGVWLSLRYDLRAPSFGAPAAALYRAASKVIPRLRAPG